VVPGTVIASTASTVRVAVSAGETAARAKTTAILVSLRQPLACQAAPSGRDLKQIEDFLLSSSAKEDADKLAALFKGSARVRRIVLEPAVSDLEVAVTEEARTAKTPDFLVHLKTPLSCAKAPAAGTELDSQSGPELVGTYDTFAQIAAADSVVKPVQIILRDGVIQQAKKKSTPPHNSTPAFRKPAHS
jgi:hypothetical protein